MGDKAEFAVSAISGESWRECHVSWFLHHCVVYLDTRERGKSGTRCGYALFVLGVILKYCFERPATLSVTLVICFVKSSGKMDSALCSRCAFQGRFARRGTRSPPLSPDAPPYRPLSPSTALKACDALSRACVDARSAGECRCSKCHGVTVVRPPPPPPISMFRTALDDDNRPARRRF